ncbi:MAG: restriction endonuclease subunit S [Muribaculaceae bacterium]|nr:restriction endonuclease subunit S [Muribaculaceae bacterium]
MKVDKSLWKKNKLSDLFDLQMGKTPTRRNLSLWEDGDIPWVSISDMKNKRFISESKELLPYFCCPQSILFCRLFRFGLGVDTGTSTI